VIPGSELPRVTFWSGWRLTNSKGSSKKHPIQVGRERQETLTGEITAVDDSAVWLGGDSMPTPPNFTPTRWTSLPKIERQFQR
jgi:hypothetical protein